MGIVLRRLIYSFFPFYISLLGKTSSGVKLDTDLLGVGLEVVSMVTSTEVIAGG